MTDKDPANPYLDFAPMSSFDARIHGTNTILAIIEELCRQGIRPLDALQGTGLSETTIAEHSTRASYRQLDQLLDNMLRRPIDPNTALNAGNNVTVTSYGMYGFAMLCSKRLSDVIALTESYVLVGSPFCRANFSGDITSVTCQLSPLFWRDTETEKHRFAIEFALSAHQKVFRDLLGQEFQFKSISTKIFSNSGQDKYEKFFNCQFIPDYEKSTYSFSTDFMLELLRFPDDRMKAMAKGACDELLSAIYSTDSVSSSTRRVLAQHLGQTLALADVAALLDMNPRTFRRKLESEGTTFRAINAEVKAEVARKYLQNTSISIEEIASITGFSDAANFRRSFKRVTGLTPSDVRGE